MSLEKISDNHKNVFIDTYVIMPNHVHAIIAIDVSVNKLFSKGQALGLSLHKTLSKIICDFKSFASRKINKIIENNEKFKWQRSFYDHIIRNDKSLSNVRRYIMDNPKRWDRDENNIQNTIICRDSPKGCPKLSII